MALSEGRGSHLVSNRLAHALSDAAAAAAEVFDLNAQEVVSEFLNRVASGDGPSLPKDSEAADRFAAKVAAEVCFGMKKSLRIAIQESELTEILEAIPDNASPLALDAMLLRTIGAEVERIAKLQGLRRLTVLQNLARAERLVSGRARRGGSAPERSDPLEALAQVIAARAAARGTQLRIRPRSVQIVMGRPRLEDAPRPFVADLPRRAAAEQVARYSAGRDLRVTDAHHGWSITMRTQRAERRRTLSFWMNDGSTPVRIRTGDELLALLDPGEQVASSAEVGDSIEIRGLPQA